MDIRLEKSSRKEAATVVAVKAPFRIEKHLIYRGLDEGDKKYLGSAVAVFDANAKSARVFILPSGKVLMTLPLGEKKEWSRRKLVIAIRRAVQSAKAEGLTDLELYPSDFAAPGLALGAELVELIATQAEIANFEFNKYREAPSDGFRSVKQLRVVSEPFRKPLEAALARGKILGEEINKAREISNTPGGDMTPSKLAEVAIVSGKQAGFSVKVLDENKIKELGMGGVLGVAKGSDEPPRFIVMEYWGGKPRRPKGAGVPTEASGKSDSPVVLVGKGVTFDTGGLNLKPEHGIYEMHMDMSGGAAVIHVIASLARLKVKKNIIGLIPAVENMPSGSSYRPGDLLKTMSGKTIEVMNTDAEGRVILADALTYAKKFYQPKLIIDIATLTGAASVALGQRASAIFTTEPRLERALRDTGEQTGDYVWPLPLWEEYEEDIRGTFGDVANVGKTRYGGAITGAVFLWQFVKAKEGPQTPWVHIDIAPRMTTIESDALAKGAAGASIALLTRFLRG